MIKRNVPCRPVISHSFVILKITSQINGLERTNGKRFDHFFHIFDRDMKKLPEFLKISNEKS